MDYRWRQQLGVRGQAGESARAKLAHLGASRPEAPGSQLALVWHRAQAEFMFAFAARASLALVVGAAAAAAFAASFQRAQEEERRADFNLANKWIPSAGSDCLLAS